MDTGLAGKRVLVTGGSGGIGAACARARSWPRGARRRALPPRARTRRRRRRRDRRHLEADLTDEAQVERLFYEAREALGRVDVCAAVAGFWPRGRRRSGSSASTAGRRRCAQPDRDLPRSARIRARRRAERRRLARADLVDRRPLRRGRPRRLRRRQSRPHGTYCSRSRTRSSAWPRRRASTPLRRAGRNAPMTRGHVDPSRCAASRGRWRSARSRNRGRRRAGRRPRLRRALRPRHGPDRHGRRWHGRPNDLHPDQTKAGASPRRLDSIRPQDDCRQSPPGRADQLSALTASPFAQASTTRRGGRACPAGRAHHRRESAPEEGPVGDRGSPTNVEREPPPGPLRTEERVPRRSPRDCPSGEPRPSGPITRLARYHPAVGG